MVLTRAQKEAMVSELNEKFAKANVTILADFTGLKVSEATELRKILRDEGVEFKVSKNTLFRRAVKNTPAQVLEDKFIGPNAVAFGYDDPVVIAKKLVEFSKDHPALKIKGGVLDGKFMEEADIVSLSKLPSKEVLLSQLLSVLVAPTTGLVQALSGIPRKLLYALQAISEKKAA